MTISYQQGAPPKNAPVAFSIELLVNRMAKQGITTSSLQKVIHETHGMNLDFNRLLAGGQPSYQMLWCIAQVHGCRMDDLVEVVEEKKSA